MFDMSWGEVMVIGAVALIVIGPKDLPKALRTVGQMTGKIRRMASEFQGQFNDAMREAELDEIRKQVADVNRQASFNPIQTVRDELKTAIESKPGDPPAPAAAPEPPPPAEPFVPLPEPVSADAAGGFAPEPRSDMATATADVPDTKPESRA